MQHREQLRRPVITVVRVLAVGAASTGCAAEMILSFVRKRGIILKERFKFSVYIKGVEIVGSACVAGCFRGISIDKSVSSSMSKSSEDPPSLAQFKNRELSTRFVAGKLRWWDFFASGPGAIRAVRSNSGDGTAKSSRPEELLRLRSPRKVGTGDMNPA
jgi:hypothetical protein